MQNLKEINERTPIGYNDKLPSNLLTDGMYLKIDNAMVDNGRLKKRNGSTAIGTALGSKSILGLTPYEPIAASKYIIACLDGASNAQLYSWAGSGNFATLGSANLTAATPMNFVQASNRLFGFNGTEVVDVDSTLTVTRNRATVPTGTYGVWFHNYLFVANTASFPSRLFFSNVGTPTTFTGTDFLDINANDGDFITWLQVFNDELYIFKQNSIWSITGWSGSTFTATTIAAQNLNSRLYGYGTPAGGSVIVTGRDLYYLSHSGGVPHFRSLVQTTFASTLEQGIISDDIDGTLNGINKTKLSKVQGIYDGRYCYWAVPNGSSAFNNLVLVHEPTITHKKHKSWATWSGINPAQFATSRVTGTDTVFFGDATTGGRVFKFDNSVFTDNGTAVAMDIRTRDFMFNNSRKTHYKYLYLKFLANNAGSLRINSRIDEAASYTNQAILSQASGSPGLGPTGSFTLGVSVLGGTTFKKTRVNLAHLTGTLCGLQFTESTANASELYDYQLHGQIRSLRGS